MNALQKAQELIENNKSIPVRLLFIAYLQLHIEKPYLHPDDHLRNDGDCPYRGWEVILCHEALKHEISEDLHYPTAFLKLEGVIDDLYARLEKEYRRTGQDLDYQMWGNTGDVKDWLDDIDTPNLHMAYEALQKLYLNDPAAEEAEILRICADVLTWIAQQADPKPQLATCAVCKIEKPLLEMLAVGSAVCCNTEGCYTQLKP